MNLEQINYAMQSLGIPDATEDMSPTKILRLLQVRMRQLEMSEEIIPTEADEIEKSLIPIIEEATGFVAPLSWEDAAILVHIYEHYQ